MRSIGTLEGKTAAQLFVDYLYVKGVDCEAERESGDRWLIWVHAEEQLDDATELFRQFTANPADPSFAAQAQQAPALRAAAASEDEAYQRRVRNRAETVASLQRGGVGRFTVGLMAVCVVIFLAMQFNEGLFIKIWYWLKISNFAPGGGKLGLPEVFHGQIWRLVTPILMHGGWLHIFFNLWWLKDLGGILEWKMGARSLFVLILLTAVGSNLAQYYDGGPNFLGISGVVFGLMGFIWMKGKYDPNFGVQLPPVIVFMMLLWLVLGYAGILEGAFGAGIANTAHTAGLVMGMVCAFLPYFRASR